VAMAEQLSRLPAAKAHVGMFDETLLRILAVRHYRCMTTNESLHQVLRLLRARRKRLTQEIGAVTEQLPSHIR
jgi:hypothetical protein